MKLQLIKTCAACPEQYDVMLDGKEIGYMRLRHGFFRAEYADKIVYTATPKGDGSFTDEERSEYLSIACAMIFASMNDLQYDVIE